MIKLSRLFITALLLISFTCRAQDTGTRVDPNHTSTGGYGYLIGQDSKCSVWWCEGIYKVMKNAPIPTKSQKTISLAGAKNEWESFQIVVNPNQPLEKFRIAVSSLTSDSGEVIPSSEVTLRKVEYVNVTHPTDSYGFKGKWPDPLPLYKGGETIYSSENQPFWISVKIPENAKAGGYKGEVSLSSGEWGMKIPLQVEVWDFTLPSSPTMRSGFGMNINSISAYDNLTTQQQKSDAFEYYMSAFRDYKISPYDPFTFSPIKEVITGIEWTGGFFDNKEKHGGTYSYMVVDNSATENIEATHRTPIKIEERDKPYRLSWWAKAQEDKQPFVVGVECYDIDGELIIFENRYDEYSASTEWKEYSLNLGVFPTEAETIQIRLFPSKRMPTGEFKGTVWFDDIMLTAGKGSSENLFAAGGFEVDIDKIDIVLDFTDFNVSAKKYFDEYGFNSYRLNLKGLGGGTYYSRTGGVFEGFAQGTDEYYKLMERYLTQIQDNLEKNGMLGKEYIYWFDEPNEADYPFVYETNAMIKKYAPKLTTFLTEHVAGQDISDVTDISCTIWHKLNHDKIKQMNDKGLEYWSYLCVWPKSPWLSEFIDHDAVNMRMWLWASYIHRLKGILIWETTNWNSDAASPAGYLQNPWDEAMSWVHSYGWILGKQTIWGNGDGRLFYPINRDPNNDKTPYVGEPVPSLRLETVRDGIEDYEYLVMLENLIAKAPKSKKAMADEAKELLNIPTSIYTDEQTYNKNPQAILEYRRKIAEAIIKLK